MKITTVVLTLEVKNNNPLLRGSKHAVAVIERYALAPCHATRRAIGEYELQIPHYTDEGLDKIVADLLCEIPQEAHAKKCISKSRARLEGPIVSDKSPKEKVEPIFVGRTTVVLA